MDAVGTIGGTWHDWIEKYDLVPPFLHLYGGIGVLVEAMSRPRKAIDASSKNSS